LTNEHDILSFEQKIEKRNFVFNDELLKQLFEKKLEKMRRQSEESKKVLSLLKRTK